MAMATPGKTRGTTAAASRRGLSPWLAPSPGKRWTELFFLLYSPTWILWCLCILVPFKIYEVRWLDAGKRAQRHLLNTSFAAPVPAPGLPADRPPCARPLPRSDSARGATTRWA